MSRPLHRGSSGGGARLSIGGTRDYLDYREPLDSNSETKDFENGCSAAAVAAPSRSRQGVSVVLFNLGLTLIVMLAILVSLYWTISISMSSRVGIYKGYRRLQEQLVLDLSQIGELSLSTAKPKELEFCPPEYENHVPCYNSSSYMDSEDSYVGRSRQDRQCVRESAATLESICLVPPPRKYRIPLRWPTGRDFIWKNNVKVSGQEFSLGSLTKRMMVEEEHISFHSDSLMVDGVEDYSHQIAEMIGLRNDSNFIEAGVRTVLDIECGFGSFGAHLSSKQLLIICLAGYEISGSQVQLTLERGLPAIIGSFTSKQLPFPVLSFDMVHCANGIFLIEVDRLLRPGGFFVWTSALNTHRSLQSKENQKKWTFIRDFAERLCWDMLAQQDETIIWKKTIKKNCYSSRKSGPNICGKTQDPESPYYESLHLCIGGTHSQRWIPIESRTVWPSRSKLSSDELSVYGVHQEDFSDDLMNWNSVVRNHWSLLSPLIFSDHPKRPGDEDPSPPYNMLRNVLDMNARFGGFNAALLDAGKSVWVMNVVPVNGVNYLPLILDRGLVGIQHDWCEAFPTYPRTYDMIHADGLLSLEAHRKQKCSLVKLFAEIDRILRPEGWVILRDTASLIEETRSVTSLMKWDARMMETDVNSDERLLLCQKPFIRKQQ
ncbi:unnamed protein product [Spirodela intermedia]|uniref:Methyltransferase n=1 Tax=Spirodela intermedia TaxID=51605 RepID=A0A7I8J433_SPIIN|nr:unnamed protein product [Spirodela intermedia]CAA6665016.1 unnamed protein product [Spirodela intermedia]